MSTFQTKQVGLRSPSKAAGEGVCDPHLRITQQLANAEVADWVLGPTNYEHDSIQRTRSVHGENPNRES